VSATHCEHVSAERSPSSDLRRNEKIMLSAHAFLSAIRDDPANDDLRLVFADWLDEQDNPRGEVIRLAVLLAQLSDDEAGHEEMEQQLHRLERLHAAEFLGPLQDRVYHWTCPRGLLALEARAPQFFPLPEQLPDVYPWIERVQCWMLADVGCDRLLELQRFPQLTALDLNHNHLGPELAETLVQLPNLPHLSELCLWQNELGEEGLRNLAKQGVFQRLRSIDLSNNQLSSGSLLYLDPLLSLNPLDCLDLRGNPIGDDGVLVLVSNPVPTNLRKLFLGHCGLTDTAASSLVGNGCALASLRLLWLNSNQIGLSGVTILADSQNLPSLEELSLASNPLGPAGASILARSLLWQQLAILDLSECSLGDEGVTSLAFSDSKSLHSLDLTENGIGPDGAVALASGPLLAGLKSLTLDGNRINDAGVVALAESSLASGLRTLHLEDNYITDLGAVTLANSPHLNQVRSLKLNRNAIRRGGQAALKHRFGTRAECG
jgi:uncharacterized protein (TIGR02996 family)